MKRYPFAASMVSLPLILLFAVSVSAVTRARESKLNGGWQIWIEASDFAEQDPDESIQLGAEADKGLRNKVADPVLGEDFVIAPVQAGWMSYEFKSPVAGDAYLYPRRMDYRGGGQSWHVMLNTEDIGQGLPLDSLGAQWGWVHKDPATDAQFDPLAPMPLIVGANTARIAPRESGPGVEILMDIICISTVVFDPAPNDDDWWEAEPFGGKAVQPGGKLSTMWGAIKDDHR